MAARYRFSQQMVIAALEQTHGLVFKASKLLGCSHQTIYNYAKKYPKVRDAITAERGLFVDLGEAKLYEATERGEAWAVTLLLKTLGKDRNYTERSELTGAAGGPLAVAVGPDVESMTDEQLNAYIATINKALAGLSGAGGE